MLDFKILRNQKGYTTAEIVISLLIIIATLGVIVMVYSNLTLNAKATDRQAGATRIATNILETASQKYFDEIEEELERIGINNNQICKVEGEGKIFSTTVPRGYTVEIKQTQVEGKPIELVKRLEVSVKYTLNSYAESVDLYKDFTREIAREVNSPSFEKSYLQPIINDYSGEKIYMSTEDLATIAEGYVICPIKYNGQNYSVITDENELKTMWYSYSGKQWAKIAVLPIDTYNTKVVNGIISDTSTINSIINNDNDKTLYVWIPRFDVISGEYLNGGAYFKYKDTNFAIQSAYEESTSELEPDMWKYYYVDFNFEGTHQPGNGTSFDENKIGEWCNATAITNNWTNAYKLNHTQYGPFKPNM